MIFNKGYQRTYDTAIKRNIPLVSARWLEYSGLINKQLDPAKYAPYDLEKYKNPLPTPKRKYYNSQVNYTFSPNVLTLQFYCRNTKMLANLYLYKTIYSTFKQIPETQNMPPEYFI